MHIFVQRNKDVLELIHAERNKDVLELIHAYIFVPIINVG